MSCKIIGAGSFLPNNPITNDELAKLVDTNDEWIKTRTGILQRYFANEQQPPAELAYQAAKKAIDDAQISPTELDLIIVCTSTASQAFPSTATLVQGYLGLSHIPSFDVNAVCGGFIYGLHLAGNLIKANSAKKILLIGAEKMSSLLDWSDRSTAVLFGDGAGAAVISASSEDLFDSQIYSDGSFANILYADRIKDSKDTSQKIFMQGSEVYRQAINKMSEACLSLLQRNNLTIDEIDFFVPHQANIRIMEAVAEKIGIASEKVVATVEKHANTSAASIPLALADYKNSGKFIPGKLGLFTAIGAGLTWGSALIRL